jgi:hypothetical protein
MADNTTSEKDLMAASPNHKYYIFEKEGDYTSDILFFKDPDALIMFLLNEIQTYGTEDATLRTSSHIYEVKKKLDDKHLH